MPRIMIMVAGVVSLLLAACSPADVALGGDGGGGGGGATEPAAPAAAEPPAEEPFLKGPVTSVTRTKPVTTVCVSEDQIDADGDGVVSDADPPVCNPNPETHGSVGVKGNRADQGGDTEIVAYVKKTVPIMRRAGGSFKPVAFDDLRNGEVVSLWITGPVMESYPLQGEASFIVVEKQ